MSVFANDHAVVFCVLAFPFSLAAAFAIVRLARNVLG